MDSQELSIKPSNYAEGSDSSYHLMVYTRLEPKAKVFFIFCFTDFFRNKLGSEDEIKIKIKFIQVIVFPLILIKLENGPNEFYFYFTI